MTGCCHRTSRAISAVLGVMLLGCCVSVSAESLQKAVEAFDFEEYGNAAQWLVPWAEKGEMEAQYRLGIMLEEGRGMPRNIDEAVDWYQKAARAGHVGARKRLKKLQKSAIAEEGQESVAFDWYQEKANKGDVNAQYQLGYMYETGWSTPKDETKAAYWYEIAASDDSTLAQLRLGLMSITGAGVAPSDIQGSRWLRAAARQKNILAAILVQKVLDAPANIMVDTGKIMARVRELSQKNEAAAISYVTQAVSAAQLKFDKEEQERRAQAAKSQVITSATEQSSKEDDPRYGLDAQGRKTLAWYRRHADRGDIGAQVEMARRFMYGEQMDLDIPQALGWYQTAAAQEHVEAQYLLGMFDLYGIGTDQNSEAGQQMLARAAVVGHAEANEALARLDEQGKPLTDESIAVWWLKQIATHDPVAQWQLGQLYERGRGVAQNSVAATQWLAMADNNAAQRRQFANPPVPPVVPVTQPKLSVRAPEALAAAERDIKPLLATGKEHSISEPVAMAPAARSETPAVEANGLVVWSGRGEDSGTGADPSPASTASEEAPTRPSRAPAWFGKIESNYSKQDLEETIPTGGSPLDEPGPLGTSTMANVGQHILQLLELDKFKANWMWLLGLGIVLVAIPFFLRSPTSRRPMHDQSQSQPPSLDGHQMG